MNSRMAVAVAEALGGQVEADGVRPGGFSVGVTRPDGRYAHIDEDAGAVYFDRHACHVGYLTTGSDPRGVVEAESWGEWWSTRTWAGGLARLLGRDAVAHQSGGNIWVVLYDRPDGRFVLIGGEGAEVYRDRDHYESGADDAPWIAWDDEG